MQDEAEFKMRRVRMFYQRSRNWLPWGSLGSRALRRSPRRSCLALPLMPSAWPRSSLPGPRWLCWELRRLNAGTSIFALVKDYFPFNCLYHVCPNFNLCPVNDNLILDKMWLLEEASFRGKGINSYRLQVSLNKEDEHKYFSVTSTTIQVTSGKHLI